MTDSGHTDSAVMFEIYLTGFNFEGDILVTFIFFFVYFIFWRCCVFDFAINNILFKIEIKRLAHWKKFLFHFL